MKYFRNLAVRTRNNTVSVSEDKTRVQALPFFELLVDHPGISKDTDYRVKMTVSCKDCDYIPKVKNAGKIKKIGNKKYQIMHNGVLVENDGYYGEWMSKIIQTLKGHHEPQEEKVFHEILKFIPDSSAMIELGAYWSYYSLWFNKQISGATNLCCEPDPENLKLGQRNARANGAKNIHFILSAAGKDDQQTIQFKPQEDDRPPVAVPIRSIDSIMQEHKLDTVAVVHMDVQGAELSAIEGARVSVEQGKIRFMIVSTHHYSISGDNLTHERCLSLIKEMGGNIITEHAIHESFSGDGLIVASFFVADKGIKIDVSENRMSNNLFRSYTEDLDIVKQAYERLREAYQETKDE